MVIGSGFGFSAVCLALGLKDNSTGHLNFVDPSYSAVTDGIFKTVGGTSQWDDPVRVRRRFDGFGVGDLVTHHHMRSDEFFACYGTLGLPEEIDIAFIDGSHAYDDMRFDFMATLRRAHKYSYLDPAPERISDRAAEQARELSR